MQKAHKTTSWTWLPQRHAQARNRPRGSGTRPAITADATNRVSAVLVDELGHGTAQQAAARVPVISSADQRVEEQLVDERDVQPAA